MAKTQRSRKDKGNRLEMKVAEALRHSGIDPKAQRMPRSGAMSHFRADVFTQIPYHIEAKNQERVRLWEFWTQAVESAPQSETPVLVLGANHRPPVAVVSLDTLVHLLQCERQLDEVLVTGSATKGSKRKVSQSKFKRRVDGTVVPREEV